MIKGLHPKNLISSERGNVFTVMLAGVGLAGLLGAATYSLLSGPLASLSRVSSKGITDSSLTAAARITLLHATTQAGGGDCDGDGYIEPVAFDAATNKPVNGGILPFATLGAPAADAWGTPIGYCVWDIGDFDAVACGGPSSRRLNGTDDPLTGETVTQTVVAFISAGPDRRFQATCSNYVDATTALVSAGNSDDIVHSYAYATAAQAGSALWRLKAGDPDTGALTSGLDAQIGAGIAFDSSSGAGNFLAVAAEKLVDAGYGAIIGDNVAVPDSECIEYNDAGLIRYTTNVGGSGLAGIEFCNGVEWLGAGTGGSGGPGDTPTGGVWTRQGNDIYYKSGNVLIGTSEDTPSSILKITSDTNAAVAIRNYDACSDCGGTLEIRRGRQDVGDPEELIGTDTIGSINWQAFGSDFNNVAELRVDALDAPLASIAPSRMGLHTMASDGVIRSPMTVLGSSGTHLTEGLVLYYKLDETSGNTIVDYSGLGNNGTFGDGVDNLITTESVSGKIGRGIEMTVNNAQVGGLSPVSLDDLGPKTVCTWVYPTNASFARIGIRKGWTIDQITNNTKPVAYYQSRFNDRLVPNETYLEIGSWQHICFTWDGTEGIDGMKGYRNGLPTTASASLSTVNTGTTADASTNLAISYSNDRAIYDEVRIYNRVLTAEEIAAVARFDGETQVVDESGAVGIGTAAPEAKIHVLQDSDADYTTPAIVSTLTLQQSNNVAATPATAWPVTLTSGNLLIVVAGCWKDTANCSLTISDNSSSTGSWTQAAYAGARQGSYVFYKRLTGVPSSPYNITLTAGAANTFIRWGGWEVSNIRIDVPLSRTQCNNGSTANYSTSPASNNPPPNAFAVGTGTLRTNDTNVNYAAAASWTQDMVQQDGTTGLAFSGVRYAYAGQSFSSLAHTWVNDAAITGGGYTAGGSRCHAIFEAATAAAAPPSANTVVIAGHSDSATAAPTLDLQHSNNSVALGNGTVVATIDFSGYDGNAYQRVGRIEGIVNTADGGAVGATNMPVDLVFKTGTSTAALAERMRFSSNAYLGIGTTSPKVRLDIAGNFLVQGDSVDRANTISGEPIVFDGFTGSFLLNRRTLYGTYGDWNSNSFAFGENNRVRGIRIGEDQFQNSNYWLGIGDQTGGNASASTNQFVGIGEFGMPGSGTTARLTNIGQGSQVRNSDNVAIGGSHRMGTGTITKSYFIGQGVETVTGTASYNFLLGVREPTTLNTKTRMVNGQNNVMLFYGGMDTGAAGGWGIGTVTPSHVLDVVGVAEDDDSTTWVNASDIRLKNIHGVYGRGLDDIRALRTVRFNYKPDNPMGYESDRENIGFIAQDVQPYFPEAISKDDKGYLQFNMHSISVAMVNALKELDQSNKSLRVANDHIRDENAHLKQAISAAREKLALLEEKPFFTQTKDRPWPGSALWLLPLAVAAGALIARKKGGRHER